MSSHTEPVGGEPETTVAVLEVVLALAGALASTADPTTVASDRSAGRSTLLRFLRVLMGLPLGSGWDAHASSGRSIEPSANLEPFWLRADGEGQPGVGTRD